MSSEPSAVGPAARVPAAGVPAAPPVLARVGVVTLRITHADGTVHTAQSLPVVPVAPPSEAPDHG